MDIKEVGNRIKFLREQRNLNRNQLANNAGVSPTYIYQLERGEKSPTIEYLNHICWGLGITINEFFTLNSDDKTLYNKLSLLTENQKKLLNDFLSSL